MKTDQADCVYLDAPLAVEQLVTEKPKRPTRPQRPPKPAEPNEGTRSAVDPKDIDAEKEAEVKVSSVKTSPISDVPKLVAEESVEPIQTVETVPERILKVAEAIKEEENENTGMEIVEIKKENAVESINGEESKLQVEKTEKTV